jgi:hypothetical protein
MSNNIYIVKSFSRDLGYLNLRCFVDFDDAKKYAKKVEREILENSTDEDVEIEEIFLHQEGELK